MWRLIVIVWVGCSYHPKGAPSGDEDDPSATIDAPRNGIDAAPLGIDAPPNGIDAPANSITCPGMQCGAVCCQGSCAVAGMVSTCTGKIFTCDGPEDCSGTEVCCNNKNGSTCTTSACNGSGRFEVCHSNADCSFSCNDCSFRQDYGQQVCCE